MNEKEIRKATHQISGICGMIAAAERTVNGETDMATLNTLFALMAELFGQALVDLHRIADAQERLVNLEIGKCP